MRSPRPVHYVLSSHWDREWYATFQDFRYKLVSVLDRIFDALEDGRLLGPFQTDGQAIMVSDYLEIRPEALGRMQRLARAGKLAIGPWYVIPDEFLVSGESLVRNLQFGLGAASAMGGEPSRVLFLNDTFGHNSQMPQLAHLFNLSGGFIWRGVNHHRTRQLRWRGADGSTLACHRFGRGGYWGYSVFVRANVDPSDGAEPSEVRARLERYLQTEAEATALSPILLFDGADHTAWDEPVYDVLREYLEKDDDTFQIRHSSLGAYMKDVLAEADRIDVVVTGELREPGRDAWNVDEQTILAGTASSRVWIKAWNARCETLLTLWAEPLCAWASLTPAGPAYPEGFLTTGWRWLLQNHPHDSICGCSIDAVHDDMRFRFAQAEQLAERLTLEATHSLAKQIGDPGDAARVTLFNPLPYPLKDVVTFKLRLPTDYPRFGPSERFQNQLAFRLYTTEGQVPYQRLRVVPARAQVRTSDVKAPELETRDEVTVALWLELPPLGYTSLFVQPGEVTLPTSYTGQLITGERTAENDLIALTVEPNGSLTLTDKRSGEVYANLNTFEERGDVGDGWTFNPPENDQVFLSIGAATSLSVLTNGRFQATFRVRTILHVPRAFAWADHERARESVPLVITSDVTLKAGSDLLEITTTVNNTAQDHRVCVLFPSGVEADTYVSDTPFDVVTRPVALQSESHTYREPELAEKPQTSFTALRQGDRGLAVLSTGLYESAVRDAPARPIALTLFRGTRQTPFTSGEPGQQVLGELSFRYGLTPLREGVPTLELCQRAQRFAAGTRAVQVERRDVLKAHRFADRPAQASFIEAQGAVATSLQRSAEALVVRAFNPSTERSTFTLISHAFSVVKAQQVDLEGQVIAEVAVKDDTVSLELRAKQIVTLRLTGEGNGLDEATPTTNTREDSCDFP